MKNLITLSVLALSLLLAGCATYESRPVSQTTVTEYGHGPVVYYPAPSAYYVVPAPVAPVYVAPAPSFNMYIQSGPHFRRHEHSHDGRTRLRGGKAENSRIGGPGWQGSVWSR